MFIDGVNIVSVSGDLYVFDLYVFCNIVVNFGVYDGSKILEIVDNSFYIIVGINSFFGIFEI